jgi:hypothetical protein
MLAEMLLYVGTYPTFKILSNNMEDAAVAVGMFACLHDRLIEFTNYEKLLL